MTVEGLLKEILERDARLMERIESRSEQLSYLTGVLIGLPLFSRSTMRVKRLIHQASDSFWNLDSRIGELRKIRQMIWDGFRLHGDEDA